MLAHHHRMLVFDHWANLETLSAARTVADRAPRALACLAHVAAAKRLWFVRVAGGQAPLPVWPTLTADDCRRHLVEANDEWLAHLARVSESDLAGLITYTNTRGETFSSRLDDILSHLPLHGHHHRGQAAAAIREAGGAPPTIDFIHAARQRFV
jgi:uncharacterized damage-inducible protein DinB